MGGASNELSVEAPEGALGRAGSPETTTDRDTTAGIRLRAQRVRVYLPGEADEGATYHTTQLCSNLSTPAETVERERAEARGLSFCWDCFELEMQALAE